MGMSTKDVIKWGAGQWQANVKHVTPSKGGAVGVMFCWCRFPGSGGPDYNKAGTADFVLKASAGSAAPAKFAEHVLEKTVGAKTVHTEGIRKGTPEFTTILDILSTAKNRLAASVQFEDNDRQSADVLPQGRMGKLLAKQASAFEHSHHMVNPKRRTAYSAGSGARELLARWTSVWNHYQTADTFLIQELATAMVEFGDVYKDEGSDKHLRNLLTDADLMVNLGKLFAADAVLGNGDRLCSVNTGNILFDRVNSAIWAIDSGAILVNYEELCRTKGNEVQNKIEGWVQQSVQPNIGVQIAVQPGAIQAPVFSMSTLLDPDTWFRVHFRGHLEFALHRDKITLADAPQEGDWDTALFNFKRGLSEGLHQVDRQLSGIRWLFIKGKFKEYVQKYGGDPNLDWTNFKLRRMYIKAILADKDNGKSITQKQESAMKTVLDYAKGKLQGVQI